MTRKPSKPAVRHRSVWVVEMADANFEWVVCAGNDSPSAQRVKALEAMRKIKSDFPHEKLRVTRYEATR